MAEKIVGLSERPFHEKNHMQRSPRVSHSGIATNVRKTKEGEEDWKYGTYKHSSICRPETGQGKKCASGRIWTKEEPR